MRMNNQHLYHGSEWPEYEDLLVGNRDGLLALKQAIDEALQSGESNTDIGEFLGVRCLEDQFFDSQSRNSTSVSKSSFILISALLITAVIVAWLVTNL